MPSIAMPSDRVRWLSTDIPSCNSTVTATWSRAEYLRGRKLIKRVSFLGRADGVTSEQFVKEWWNVHDRLVQTVPGCVGYNQDLVIDRIDGGVSVPYEELPVEGVVEMWFETKEAFDEYYASPEFARASAHSSEFIGAINTYLTETYPVALPSA